MILNPRFYEPIAVDRGSERQRLGLDRELPTGLVLFGGEGSMTMLEIATRLQSTARPLQLILICGRNEKLAAELRAMRSRVPMFVEGFTREVPYYMHLSDFFIGKPGPGSISEAIAMKLPVIVERNAWNLPQERYNTEWVREQRVGLVLRNFRQIGRAVEEPAGTGNLRRIARPCRLAYESRRVRDSGFIGGYPRETRAVELSHTPSRDHRDFGRKSLGPPRSLNRDLASRSRAIRYHPALDRVR